MTKRFVQTASLNKEQNDRFQAARTLHDPVAGEVKLSVVQVLMLGVKYLETQRPKKKL